VVFGDTRVLDEVREATGGLGEFRRNGGAILIASDRRSRHRLDDLGVVVSGAPVRQVEGEPYWNERQCPLIRPTLDDGHPVLSGVGRIATNRPSFLATARWSDLKVRAFLSGVSIGDGPQGAQPAGDLPYLAASNPDARGGHVVVLAGHGVFMNGMVAQPDNENFVLAFNCVRWLTDGGKRRHVLFVEEGKVQTSFDVPLAEMPPLPMPRTEVLNRLLRGLEEENRFNELLLNHPGKANLVRGLLVTVSVLLALYVIWRLFVARHHIDPWQPLLARRVELALAALPVLAQRRAELLRRGNYWETARAICRETFDALGASPDDGRVPSFTVSGGRWRRWHQGRRVRGLWHLAHGADPQRVSQRRLARLLEDLGRVRAEVDAGTIVFATGDGRAPTQGGS
jgi:hypothetical protein